VSRAEENKQTLDDFLERSRRAAEAATSSSDPDLATAATWILKPVTSADSRAMAHMFRENIYKMQDDAALLAALKPMATLTPDAVAAAWRLKRMTLMVAVTLDKYLEDFFDALWKSADTGEDIEFLADG
jgi:aryl-alcohol dehydrogenase-like predicted oxidoreductase